MRTRVAGIFLFLPLLARLGFDQIVRQAGYPGSKMVPATSALLSLLTLKLLDKERRSHIEDFSFDQALGMFAGLNVLPKKSFATDFSYRTVRDQQQKLLQGWVKALWPVMFPDANTFSLDFHPIPYRGDPEILQRHYLPRRGVAGPSIQSFFVLEQKSRCLCYSNTNVVQNDQQGEAMRFVELWKSIAGVDPSWLYFDSRLIDYSHMSQIHQRGIFFITIRRRGAAILRRLAKLPASAWTKAVIDTPKRCHQQIRFVDETIRLRGFEGNTRQIAVTGLGRDRPTLFLSNCFDETPRELIIRYAGRNRIEDGLGQSVNFFHLDCLASEVRLNVDLDAALTVLANGCYRWLGGQLRGLDKVAPKKLYRRFVETAGTVEARSDAIVVHFDKRSHNPILREAALDKGSLPIPWLDNRPIQFAFP